jgi:hypothetical protein
MRHDSLPLNIWISSNKDLRSLVTVPGATTNSMKFNSAITTVSTVVLLSTLLLSYYSAVAGAEQLYTRREVQVAETLLADLGLHKNTDLRHVSDVVF